MQGGPSSELKTPPLSHKNCSTALSLRTLPSSPRHSRRPEAEGFKAAPPRQSARRCPLRAHLTACGSAGTASLTHGFAAAEEPGRPPRGKAHRQRTAADTGSRRAAQPGRRIWRPGLASTSPVTPDWTDGEYAASQRGGEPITVALGGRASLGIGWWSEGRGFASGRTLPGAVLQLERSDCRGQCQRPGHPSSCALSCLLHFVVPARLPEPPQGSRPSPARGPVVVAAIQLPPCSRTAPEGRAAS